MVFSPVAWAFKDQITSAKLAQMQENIRAHDHRADGSQGSAVPFCLLGTGAVSAASAGYTAVSFPEAGELADPFGMHVAGALTRITIPIGRGGIYKLTGTAAWPSNVTGRRMISIGVNGAGGFGAQESATPPVAGAWTQTTTLDRVLAAGDYVELMVYQTSGVALAISGGLLSAVLQSRT